MWGPFRPRSPEAPAALRHRPGRPRRSAEPDPTWAPQPHPAGKLVTHVSILVHIFIHIHARMQMRMQMQTRDGGRDRDRGRRWRYLHRKAHTLKRRVNLIPLSPLGSHTMMRTRRSSGSVGRTWPGQHPITFAWTHKEASKQKEFKLLGERSP